MAQSFPIDPKVIFDTISEDTTMQSLLGSYQFRASAEPVLAVSIVTPGTDLPSTRKVEGLECVIHDSATIKRRDYLTDNSSLIPQWSVYLICWDGANGNDMTNAAMRLMELFSGAVVNETVAVPQGLGALVQVLVSIPADSPILT